MSSCFADYLDNLAELHTEIMKTVRQLPAEAFDWIPVEGANSLCVLMVHIAGAERYWLGDVIAGEPSGRDRPAEFRAKNLSTDMLEAKLNESLGYAELVLGKLDTNDLGASRIDPRNGQEVTLAWALDHTLKHTAIHLGHIQLTKQLWENSKSEDAGD
ncbi:MAG: DinB family protein [Anaerolineales bacterium]|jgi:uncharacterized damage-inducible protein DinB